jgi:glycosyltransferase involved in cell wall biosynthesis
LRIAFCTETFLPATDGVVTRLRATMDELNLMGDEMIVIAPKYGEGPGSYAGIPIHRVSSVPFPPYPQIKLAPPMPVMGRALNDFGPDLIHAVNPFVLGAGGVYYARRLGVPLVASYHTNVATYARYYGLGFGDRAGRWWTRTLHNQAHINLCTSWAIRDYLLREGVQRVHLWPQGVDARRFHPSRFTKDWRIRLSGGNPDDRLLLYVGRLAREKGIGSLRTVLQEIPNVRLAMVGDGPARRELEKEFAGTPTVFAGMRKGRELAEAYASADAFVFPSTTETLGLSMLEALASGLPVIAARTGATTEVVVDGENGLLFKPDSSASLVAAVRRVFSDEGFRQALARRARSTAEERDWESSTRTLRGYYERALEAR